MSCAIYRWLECVKICQSGKWSCFYCVGSSCEGVDSINTCHINAIFCMNNKDVYYDKIEMFFDVHVKLVFMLTLIIQVIICRRGNMTFSCASLPCYNLKKSKDYLCPYPPRYSSPPMFLDPTDKTYFDFKMIPCWFIFHHGTQCTQKNPFIRLRGGGLRYVTWCCYLSKFFSLIQHLL